VLPRRAGGQIDGGNSFGNKGVPLGRSGRMVRSRKFQIVAKCAAFVVKPEQSAALQFRNDMVQELI